MYEYNPKLVGERIKGLRRGRKMTLMKLSKSLGYSQACVCQWESGKRSPNGAAIATICSYFECSADYILFGVDKP